MAQAGPLQCVIIPTAAAQPKGGPCFDLKSVGCSFKRARRRGGHTAREGMRSFFKAWMNQLFCEHIHKTSSFHSSPASEHLALRCPLKRASQSHREMQLYATFYALSFYD